jgi:seryl-tRNA synthetase
MIDIKLIRENPEEIKARYLKREIDCSESVDRILELDGVRRDMIFKTENCRAEQKKLSKQIPMMKKSGEDTTEVFARMNELKETIKKDETELREVENEYNNLMLGLPNLPDEDLLGGGKENNVPIRYFGEPHKFDFEPKNHVDLCTDLGLIDYPRGAKLSGNGFWIYRGMGARLEWALLNYFIDTHIADGYERCLSPTCRATKRRLPPSVPEIQGDVYWLDTAEDAQRRFMLPTAETALVSLHRDEVLSEDDLPRKYISYTPCFRREAGSYRSDERGMVRGHQFNKVEMVQYTRPMIRRRL